MSEYQTDEEGILIIPPGGTRKRVLPDKVYVVGGWFGDIEWIEDGFYYDKELAIAQKEFLQKTRTTDKEGIPEWVQGLCKFYVDEWEVRWE